MIPCKPLGHKLKAILLSLLVISIVQIGAAQGDKAAGKAIFMGKCASCHNPLKDGTGPALKGLEDRHKWAIKNC
jgi:cytochrome c2